MSVTIARRALAAASALAGCCALVGCGGAPAALSPAAPSPAPASAHRPAQATLSTAVPAAVTHASMPTPPPAPPRVHIVRVHTADGALVILATFLGPVRYVLHDGSGDPGPVAGLRAGPAVTGAERGQLLAAFNGGFKLASGVGGYMQEGRVLSPLRRGLASLVIDRSGRARIGVWGGGVPVPGEAVYSVRQNLTPLVLDGRPTAAAADWGLWGATLGGGADVARSAVGQDAAGHLIYAASTSAVPADLASALASHGARIAMELDINPEWVQLDIARRPGGPLTAAIPGQARPADQYLEGWTRDFFTVLAGADGSDTTVPRQASLKP
jgi:Phosphodiester glycosidase